jgi:Piwi domain
MKGTSKPVLYRTIRCDDNDLTLELLQTLTYLLSFDYPYAPKATRMVPVIRHSSKLANQVLGFLKRKCFDWPLSATDGNSSLMLN